MKFVDSYHKVQPFTLIPSIVEPHDVGVFIGDVLAAEGKCLIDCELDIPFLDTLGSDFYGIH